MLIYVWSTDQILKKYLQVIATFSIFSLNKGSIRAQCYTREETWCYYWLTIEGDAGMGCFMDSKQIKWAHRRVKHGLERVL